MDRAWFRVEDFLDFELLLIVDKFGRRRGWNLLIGEGRRDIRGKELLIEAWVNLPMCGELQLIGGGSRLVKDYEGADALVVELLLWLREVEVCRIQPDFVTDPYSRATPSSFCRTGVSYWSPLFEAPRGFLDVCRSLSL